MERRIKGMDLYLQACSDFARALEKEDGDLAGHAAARIIKALDLLEIIEKSPATSGR